MLGLSQQQVAARLSVKATALSNWENGTRRISLDHEQIDDALDGGGVLGGLLWAFGTPKGLDPNRLWTKVFPGEPTPVWMWIRSPSPRLRLEGEWGVARVDADLELGENGLFMTVGMAVAESPVVVHLSEPSWADFGRGELPSDMPGAPVLAAINQAHRSTAEGTFVEMFFGDLADRFSRSHSRDLAKLHRSSPRSLASFFSAFGRQGQRRKPEPWPLLPAADDPVGRLRFARLRRARGLSLLDAAQRLAAVTGVEVSKDTLRRFETDVGEPHHRLLPVGLDQMLGADGHLAVAEIRADRGSGAVRLPPYWTGPVWFDFDGPSESEQTIVITWGEWSREIRGVLPMLLVYHYSEQGVPLRITASPAVSWRVGVGRRAGATPINQGWVPTSYDAAQRAIAETEDALLISLERGQSEPPGTASGPEEANGPEEASGPEEANGGEPTDPRDDPRRGDEQR